MSRTAVIQGGGVTVTFDWREDRFVHTIALAEARGATAVLESVEGDADDDWPPSPPLQELQMIEGRDERPLALLVGRAGKSHWSVSVELDAATGRLTFDAACRLQQPPARLGAAYRIVVPDTGAGNLFQLAAEPIEGRSAEWVREADRATLSVNRAIAQFPATVRWKYTLAFDLPADRGGSLLP